MAETENKALQRSRHGYRRAGGSLARVKNTASADNGRPRSIFVKHAGASKVLRHGVLDRRGTLARTMHSEVAELQSHVGGEVTLPQARLIEQAARLRLITAMAWAEVLQAGRLINGEIAHPAIAVLLRAQKEQREVFELLGIKRTAREVTLPDILAGRADLPENTHEDSDA